MSKIPEKMASLLVDAVLCLAVLASTAQGQNWYKYNSISKYYNLDKSNRAPACHERPLEVRERHADVIFTGTIRQLQDSESDGLQMAKVQIKRVMKGGHILSRLPRVVMDDGGSTQDHRKVVVVEGIGDPGICHSQAKTHDTRIFLVNKASNGQLRLNSSLVRITLDNIEKAEAAVKDTVMKPTTRIYYTRPPIERTDPCKGRHCSFGARCVASLDGLTARCQCPERCDSFGDWVDGGYVCGSDGKDYENLCQLRRKACEEMKDVQKKYEGKCDPCDGFTCPASQVCQLDSGRRPVCGCDALCPMVFEPVCGSNGKTYSNECLMKVDSCKRRMETWLMFRGECTSGKNPCHGVTCGSNRVCVVDSSNAVHCACPHSCDPILKPVCGSDGRTYPSECHLLRHSCVEKSLVTVNHAGECNTVSVCTNHVCQHEAARCVIQNQQPVCVCPACSEEYQPVCGSNGVSYTNDCKMKTENCEQKTNVTFAYDGLCDACKHKRCEFYSECVNDGRNGALCVCPTTCEMVNAKVCGSDGVTYGNDCELRLHSCRLQRRIFPISQGPCDPCADVKCNFGAKCFEGRCMCDYDCANQTDHVCGSDGLTYSDECVMQRVACSQGVEITALHAGKCEESSEESSGSGDGPMDTCDAHRCQYGGTCRPGRRGELKCVCTFNCDAIRSPVCGSDGKTHGNECQLKEESCRKQMDITVLPMDNCEDIFEELCDGKPALVDPLTGAEYVCSDSTGCPAGSYCHRLSGIGKCCGGDLPTGIKSCSETKYGCCPDGFTPASGPRYNGCPNVCQCHTLGSNGSSCDPITRQCECKEGVGGLRCDRCNPSYWGLPKISEGNKGCIPCVCNALGSMREDCEQTTGRCTCRPGITGQKCNICPNGRQLDRNGCADLMFGDHLIRALTCADKQCRFGAVCQMTNRIPECICPATCQSQDDLSTMVCGSDDQTYGSSCQLKRSACRLQRDIRVASKGPCQKITTVKHVPKIYTNNPPASPKSKNAMNSLVRITKDLTNPTNDLSNYVFGMLEDFCEENRDCFVTGSYCKNGLCACKSSLLPSNDKRTCIAERFFIPSFNGNSYLQLKRFSYASRDVSIEIQFQPQRENGILLYAGQGANGTGDFLSLSLRNGHVEFRYDLGSGMAILKTPEKVKVGTFHRVTARRFGKDGILKLDDGVDVSSTSPGMMRSLNLVTPIYLGSLPNVTRGLSNNTGVGVGFVGCVESLSVKSSERSISYDLTQDNAVDIEHQQDVRECGVSLCASSPCFNGGQCVELDAGINFECSCPPEFTGVLCDERRKAKRSLSCSSNPCQNGGSCLQLDSGHFVCNCPSTHDGDRCEKAFKQDLLHPYSATSLQFHGDSFITLRLSKTASRSISFEIWFLPIQPDGVLLYSAQENVVKGDFLSLNLIDGYVQLRYDLGSGIANITSQTTVRLGMWNKVVASRLHRLGTLSLNDDQPTKGQSGGGKRELNLPMRVYVGGYPNEFNPESGATSGFVGAIQKFFRDRKLVENLLTESLSAVHITQYAGPPCPADNNPCHNGGTCIPNLNDFECQCPDSFYGITCQMRKGDNASGRHRSIGFDGRTHHRYSVAVKERSPENFHVEVKFRTQAADGILLIHTWDPTDFDYVAIAVRGGRIQASFNIGKEKSPKTLSLVSHSPVTDDRWHNVTFTRIHHSAHLYVDHDLSTAPVPPAVESTHLGTRGHLWIGGNASNKPHGLPKAFSVGFKGCIESVVFERKILNLVEDRDKSIPISFCSADI